VETEDFWFLISAVFLVIGIVTGLGEWVFHWWNDPWEWASPLSIVVSLLAAGWGASARDLRRMRRELGSGLSDLRQGQAEQTEMLRAMSRGQEELTSVLREVVTSFRRP